MRRLLVVYGAAMTAAVIVAFLGPLALLARSTAENRALSVARQEAQSVAVVAAIASDDRLAAVVDGVNALGARRTSVFLPDGRLVGAPATRTADVAAAGLGRSFTAARDHGRDVLLPVAGPDGVAVVQTFVPDSVLHAGLREAMISLALVGFVLLAGAVVAADRIAARLSRSVRQLAEVADRIGGGDLRARMVPGGPREIESVGRVLNGLGARVSRLLAAERELVADLSHRLRTPVTALRLDAEGLRDPEERARLTAHVEQLEQQLDVVIRAARQPEAPERPPGCDAAAVVAERVRFWSVLAEDQDRALTLRLDDAGWPCPVALDASRLEAALDVLVDNVFAHTAPGVGFEVSVSRHDPGGAGAVGTVEEAVDGVWVSVQDAGEGIADPTLIQRGASGGGSTGLGLDIAARAAHDGGGRLSLGRSPLGGTRVSMWLPSPARLAGDG